MRSGLNLAVKRAKANNGKSATDGPQAQEDVVMKSKFKKSLAKEAWKNKAAEAATVKRPSNKSKTEIQKQKRQTEQLPAGKNKRIWQTDKDRSKNNTRNYP